MAQHIDIARCYDLLEVSQSATLDDVKSSYKRLALKYHPDRNVSPDATAKFQEIGSAYKAIVDHIEKPTPEPNWSPHGGSFYPCDSYRDHPDDFLLDMEFFLFMFVFGYGSGNCPPPFNFRRHRPQETNAERTAQAAREREAKAEAKERIWQQQQEKKRASRAAAERERSEKPEAKERIWQQQQEKKRANRAAAERERSEKPEERHQDRQGEDSAERYDPFKMAHQQRRSKVFAAARGGRWEQVKRGIWDDDVDVNGVEVLTGLEEIVPKPREPKETLLHLAAKAGVMDIFKWLIDHGSNTEARDSFTRTAFHLALQYGHLPLVNYIIASFPPGSHSSQPIFSPPPKASLLRLAIESNNLDIVRTVIGRFTISEGEVTKEWRRLRDPAFTNGFPISRSYGGGRGRTEVNNPTEWKKILQLLCEYVSPAVGSSSVPHHSSPASEAPHKGGSRPWTPSSRNSHDLGGEQTSKSTGGHTKRKRDKTRRKPVTGNQHK